MSETVRASGGVQSVERSFTLLEHLADCGTSHFDVAEGVLQPQPRR